MIDATLIDSITLEIVYFSEIKSIIMVKDCTQEISTKQQQKGNGPEQKHKPIKIIKIIEIKTAKKPRKGIVRKLKSKFL